MSELTSEWGAPQQEGRGLVLPRVGLPDGLDLLDGDTAGAVEPERPNNPVGPTVRSESGGNTHGTAAALPAQGEDDEGESAPSSNADDFFLELQEADSGPSTGDPVPMAAEPSSDASGGDEGDYVEDDYGEDEEPDSAAARRGSSFRQRIRSTRGPVLIAAGVIGLVMVAGMLVAFSLREDENTSLAGRAVVKPSDKSTPTQGVEATTVGGGSTADPSDETSPSPIKSAHSSSSPSSGKSVVVPPARTRGPVKPPTFLGVAGYGCGSRGSTGYLAVGRYSSGRDGWYGVGSGGYHGDGCNGTFDAMPMSGIAGRDDPAAYTEWWFKVGRASKHCSVRVYIPTADSAAVAGAPAFYTIRNGVKSDTFYASFSLNQASNQGRWLGAGIHPVKGDTFVIRLHNRGQDWDGLVKTYAHIASAQAAVNCTA
ncbi:hypothetical protein ACWGI8_05330 [Streptomyces sp. NPDC054841]